MFLLKLAFKNLSRYRTRTIITSGAIAFGIMIFIIIDSLLAGLALESELNLIAYETGGAKVFSEGYWEERNSIPLSYTLEQQGSVTEILEENKIPYAPRINFSADLIIYQDPFPEDGSFAVKVTAIDPELDPEVFRLDVAMKNGEGRWLEKDEDGNLITASDLSSIRYIQIEIVAKVDKKEEKFYKGNNRKLITTVQCRNMGL